jgi:RimJ/RimL family protein N-acetyltransferase
MVSLRKVKREDCDFFWQYANDASTRNASFLRPKQITHAEHLAWFDEKLSDPLIHFFVILNDNSMPVGQLRIDRTAEGSQEALIHIGIAPQFRGHGYACDAIKQGVVKIFAETDITLIRAYIRPENKASEKTFSNAGFEYGGMEDHAGVHSIYRYVSKH